MGYQIYKVGHKKKIALRIFRFAYELAIIYGLAVLAMTILDKTTDIFKCN